MPLTIKPTPAKRGLFDVATEVPGGDVDWGHDGWRLSAACPTGGLHTCADAVAAVDDADLLKADSSTPTNRQFKSFMVYQVAGCKSGTARTRTQIDDSKASAAMWLSTNVEGWVSAGFEIGAGDPSGGNGLIDLDDVTGATVLGIYDSMSVLIRNRTRLGMFDRPIIHMPSWAAPQVDTTRAITDVADLCFGPGYGILDDVTPTDETQGWMYITGPVEYALQSVPTLDDTFEERRMNKTYAVAESIAAVRFDPCGGFKIKAVFT